MVAVAIGAAAVVGAGATVFAGSKAASAQTSSTNAAISEQRREDDLTRSDYAPWRTAGATALGALTNAYGLTGTSTNPGAVGTEQGQPLPGSGAYGGFFTSPGYQFRRDQGLQAIDRGAAARGQLGSGATIKAEQRYGDGLAASEYDSYTSRLAQLAGLGQSATAGTAAAGSSAANNISSALINSGNARASSYTNTASAVNSGLNNVMTAYLMQNGGMFNNPSGYSNTYSGDGVGFSDRRLKTNIELIRRDPDGLGWYNWNWKTDPNGPVAHGVIADEVERLRPWAFVPDYRDGYAGVNYATLGSR
jgi:hypothetical protein